VQQLLEKGKRVSVAEDDPRNGRAIRPTVGPRICEPSRSTSASRTASSVASRLWTISSLETVAAP